MERDETTTRAPLWAQPRYLVLASRPRQWAKNLLIFLAFFFTMGEHQVDGLGGEAALLARVSIAFLLFCMLSGATYIINDLVDAPRDRQHPKKRYRPIASGLLSQQVAFAGVGGLVLTALVAGFLLDPDFGAVALLYFAMNLAYSTSLKNIVILDVLVISAGFVLRAVAGALVINVPVSPWLFVVTSLGALMIALGKRRSELAALGETSADTRSVLSQYTVPMVDQLITVVAPATLVSYILYTFTAPNLPANHAMMLTVPFVAYGLFRYLFLVHSSDMGGAPEEIFLTDRPLMVNNLLWLLTATAVLLVFGRPG
jgi:4-hydroxybenzoate polyprenyltransferase